MVIRVIRTIRVIRAIRFIRVIRAIRAIWAIRAIRAIRIVKVYPYTPRSHGLQRYSDVENDASCLNKTGLSGKEERKNNKQKQTIKVIRASRGLLELSQE